MEPVEISRNVLVKLDLLIWLLMKQNLGCSCRSQKMAIKKNQNSTKSYEKHFMRAHCLSVPELTFGEGHTPDPNRG